MSMRIPVFAASKSVQGTSQQSETVPVTSNIEEYTPSIPEEINISIPRSMAFDVGYNKNIQKTNLKSVDYTITNNGNTAVNVTSQYDLTNADGITLTTTYKVNACDPNFKLDLSLNAEQAENPTHLGYNMLQINLLIIL